MSKITTILFDFDGAIANTEPLYNVFFAPQMGHFCYANMRQINALSRHSLPILVFQKQVMIW